MADNMEYWKVVVSKTTCYEATIALPEGSDKGEAMGAVNALLKAEHFPTSKDINITSWVIRSCDRTEVAEYATCSECNGAGITTSLTKEGNELPDLVCFKCSGMCVVPND
jgi:hypothetical protein